MQISPHHRDDWCHLCGKRGQAPQADIWFSDNAEHGGGLTEYIRICADCGDQIACIARTAEAPVRHP